MVTLSSFIVPTLSFHLAFSSDKPLTSLFAKSSLSCKDFASLSTWFFLASASKSYCLKPSTFSLIYRTFSLTSASSACFSLASASAAAAAS